jgi:alkanesulfonate monooxygenase SsuD/methylene tetrahydromethanopterin reductase-like flavin-dependent oxidoreductase (luciferase family)
MKQYREDLRATMAEIGRDPDQCKVLFLISPILAETTEEAQAKAAQREAQAAKNIDLELAQLGWLTNIDFSTFDLDAPVGELATNGHQHTLAQFLRRAGKQTLREAIISRASSGASVDLVGSPDAVAAQMGEAMEEIGGDGFLISMPNVSRRTIAEIVDGLAPALQQRGLTRRVYAHRHLRDNLLEF